MKSSTVEMVSGISGTTNDLAQSSNRSSEKTNRWRGWDGAYESVRADLDGHLKYSRRWSGVRAGVLLGAQGAVHRGGNRGWL